jgi:hypothetical protein
MHTDARESGAGYSEVFSGSDPQNRHQNSDVRAGNDELHGRTFGSLSEQKNLVKYKKNPQNLTSDFLSKASFCAL